MMTKNNERSPSFDLIEIKPITIHVYPDGRMDAKNAAAYLGLSPKTLAMMRSNGTGPRYIKPGRVFYYEDQIKEWLQKQDHVVSTEQYRQLHRS